MKKQALNIIAMLSLLAALTGAATSAQSAKLMTAHIPFAFTIGQKTLPTGDYGVYRTSNPNVLILRGEDGQGGVAFITNSAQANSDQARARLEFRRYGEQHFLARVWPQGAGSGRELPQSRRERELANGATKHLAQNVSEPEIVYIAAQ